MPYPLTNLKVALIERTTYVDLALTRPIDTVVLSVTSVDGGFTSYQGRSNRDPGPRLISFSSSGKHQLETTMTQCVALLRAVSLSNIGGGAKRDLLMLWM